MPSKHFERMKKSSRLKNLKRKKAKGVKLTAKDAAWLKENDK